MTSIILYFILDIAGFVVLLLIWEYWIEKPDPYDYTTIPGLWLNAKLGRGLGDIVLSPSELMATSWDEIDEDLSYLKSFSHSRHYFAWLHANFGEIASFNWGRRYIVSVGSRRLLQTLRNYRHKMMAMNPKLFASVILGDPFCFNAKTGTKRRKGEPYFMTEENQNGIFMGQSISLIENDDLNGENEVRNETNFLNANQDKLCKEELWRPLIVMYSSEIFLSGHPVPAFIPIVLNVQLILPNEPEKLERHLDWLFECTNENDTE
ncbi:hypothetical protein Ddc_04959 [Ditylenchus destructor]|nr:hypothetical protein Ddc_04959 [Ditylenchus destructor]